MAADDDDVDDDDADDDAVDDDDGDDDDEPVPPPYNTKRKQRSRVPTLSFSIIIKSVGGHLRMSEYAVSIKFGCSGGWFRGWFRLVPPGSCVCCFVVYLMREIVFAWEFLCRTSMWVCKREPGSSLVPAWFRLVPA